MQTCRYSWRAGEKDIASDQDFERRALEHPAQDPYSPRALYAKRERATSHYYPVSPVGHTLIYKGMLIADQLGTVFPDLRDPDLESSARAGAPALQHEHVSVVAARAPVPLRRAQRRDQHAARQHQLDARARRAAPSRTASATI